MKIVLIGSRDFTVHKDGLTIYIQNLVINQYVKNTNFKFIVYFPLSNKENQIINDELVNTIDNTRLEIIYLKSLSNENLAKFTYSFLVFINLLKKFKRKEKCIFHFHGMNSNWIIPFIRFYFLKSKIIFTQHSVEHLNTSVPILKRYIAKCAYLLSKLAHKKIAVSNYVNNTMKNAVIIKNGASVINEEKLVTQFSEIKSKYGIDKFEYILFVGRLIPQKGIDYSISAFLNSELLNKKKLVIVGELNNGQQYYKRLLKLIEKAEIKEWQNKILFLDRQEQKNVLSLMRFAFINLVPSLSEGFSLVAQESINVKRFPLLSDIPAHREFELNSSFYFQAGSISSLITAINRYSFNDSFLTNNNSIQRSWDDVIIANYKIYEQLGK